MPFLTQGKTNWKYILIVVVLAVIVGGGILGYYQWFIKEEWKEKEVETLGLDNYLHKDAVLYGVDMPPEAEYQAISTNEAILIVVQNLEEQNVKDIKIRQLLWAVAPRGEFFIAGDCSFTREGEQYNEFLAVIEDGSGGKVGKPYFIFKDTDIWYSDLVASNSLRELVGGYEVLADIYNVTPIFKSSEIKDETADWKIYGNEEYGFIFKYPEKIDLGKGPTELVVKENLNPVDAVFVAYIEKPFTIGFRVLEKSKDFSNLEEYVRTETENINNTEDSAAPIHAEFNEFTIDSIKGFAIKTTAADVLGNTSVEIYFEKMDYLFVIRYSYSETLLEEQDPLESSKYDAIQKIISTFRFLE